MNRVELAEIEGRLNQAQGGEGRIMGMCRPDDDRLAQLYADARALIEVIRFDGELKE